MKASELIKALQMMIDKYGDHKVLHPCDGEGTGGIAEEIKFIEWPNHSFFCLQDEDPI